ncbi:MAG: transcriptional regulator [Deltaproteobacteria bacterium]|nr:transcriptional regulator [Deltaproteobacteria bacterium]
MGRGDQLGRQWKILQKISSARNGKAVAELISELECQRRTVYRDIEALQNAGFPLYNEKVDGRNIWFVLDNDQKIETPFNITELMALYFGRDLLKALDGTFLSDSLKSLVEKIKTKIPEESLEYLDKIEKTFQVSAKQTKFNQSLADVMKDVNDAAMAKKYIEIDYYTISRDEITKRMVAPYTIWFFNGTFYLIAYCTLRKNVRTFSIDRIKSLKVTSDNFTVPKDFNVEEYMKPSFGVFQGETTKVKIRFSKDIANIVAEKKWHESQSITWENDGSMVLEIQVAGIDEIKIWILQWGQNAVVLEPQELRDKLKKEALEMFENYRK